jgi:hypothetical protein
MRTFLRPIPVLALALFGLLATAHAQLQTFDTRPNYAGSVITFGDNDTLGQTFSNVSAVKSMTYNFFAGSGGVTGSTTVTAVFGQWNGSSFVNGTTVSFNSIVIPPNGGGWSPSLTNGPGGNTYSNYSFTFDLASLSSGLIDSTYGYLTNPNNTYAMMLSNSGLATGLALGLTNNNAFVYGAADGFGTKDWTFAQLVVAPGSQSLTSTPEPRTWAAIIGAIFVAGMVFVRSRQRQQLAFVAVR